MRQRIYYACTPAYITVIHIKTTRLRTYTPYSARLLSPVDAVAFRNNKKARVSATTRPYKRERKDLRETLERSIFILERRFDVADIIEYI